MMSTAILKGMITADLIKPRTVSVTYYDASGNPQPQTITVTPAPPDANFLNALVEIVNHIQATSQVKGNFTVAASSGMAVGVGGGVPGPVTATLTGVPVTGLGTVSGLTPVTGAVQ